MRNKLLFLITCTGIELATAVGVTGYLLYLGEGILALISGIVFAKLIVFHFIMDHYDKKGKVARTAVIRGYPYYNPEKSYLLGRNTTSK